MSTREELQEEYAERLNNAHWNPLYNHEPSQAREMLAVVLLAHNAGLAAILAELATQRQPVEDDHGPVCREPQDIDGLAKLLGGGERLEVVDVDIPAPAPVESVTSALEAVLGDSYVLGNDRSGATTKRIMLAASNDQLAAVAAARKLDAATIERLTSDLDAARLDNANLKTALQLEGDRADRLAGEHSAAHSRMTDIIDEAFGAKPTMPMDALLSTMERELADQRKEEDANATAARELFDIRELAMSAHGRDHLTIQRDCESCDRLSHLLGLADKPSGEVG